MREIPYYRAARIDFNLYIKGTFFSLTIKKLIKRSNVQLTTYHDLKARALRTPIDCTIAKRILGWKPEQDLDSFIKRGFEYSDSCDM